MNSDQLLAALPRAGVEVRDALDRFMGNESLFLSFLLRLPGAMDLAGIRQALRRGQGEEFYAKIHSLKGMAGNLSVRALARPLQLLLEEYRSNGLSRPERLEEYLEELDAAAAPLAALLAQYEAASAEGGRP